MKKHIKVNGKLLQTNKRFSQLKQTQKNWITTELYKLYHDKMKAGQTIKKLPRTQREEVISSLYEKNEDKGIWIPYGEMENYTFSKILKIVKSFKKQFLELSTEIEAEHEKKKDKK
ncbi:hypothetical protein [Paraliobacillus ryukyuensis]|uniref:hypothetical protein n=1 Tax=Paraliobacillus ryukyuensis TaxID=200904 RepID=UPI0009A88833|nr:hypothetical protein [Paraliobacillus ryukyuensis]